MKKILRFCLLLTLAAALCGCRNTPPSDAPSTEEPPAAASDECADTEFTADRTFLCETEGFGGDFTITLFADGHVNYYEGMLSSILGFGEWSVEGDILTISDAPVTRIDPSAAQYYTSDGKPTTAPADGTSGSTALYRTNRFRISDSDLIWLADGSDNFVFVKLTDGARFIGQPLSDER